MVRVLSDGDVADCLDLADLLQVVRDAFRKQGRGDVERPDRPHFPVGAGLAGDGSAPAGTGLVMPAYLHGARFYATKLVGVHEGNAQRGLPTVNAQIALTEAATGLPAGYLAGTRITNARTGCIGGLAAAELATGPVTLALVGAGTQARWQARAIAAATDLRSVRVYSPSDSKDECAADLREEFGESGVPVETAETPAEAVSDATVVVTATTATEPVFPADALAPGALVVAVGAYTAEMQELAPAVFERAARVFADVPEEVAGIGDALAADLAADDLIPLSAVFEERAGRETEDEILVVESVGTAVLDAASAEYVFEEAEGREIGTEVEL
ncbi:ornithine cyclodeaminase family protein [Halorussus gelatinilyticus]|uniref:Ornithine cyclodeaminase family protein n=1 Tax=Halorussus gelatinilyticus TaxID=2937524 RepID=A0A8U0INS2_9EURY|nr:ornithine cyclodeaminase family protein [Halorussus gelatinilyticus]UPW02112.1 ornithine cyclodeaminase family protein [Halorussus gelatinilyticus]